MDVDKMDNPNDTETTKTMLHAATIKQRIYELGEAQLLWYGRLAMVDEKFNRQQRSVAFLRFF